MSIRYKNNGLKLYRLLLWVNSGAGAKALDSLLRQETLRNRYLCRGISLDSVLIMKALRGILIILLLASCAPEGFEPEAPVRHKQGPLETADKSCRFKGVRAFIESQHGEKHLLSVTVDDIEKARLKVYELETIPPTHTHRVVLHPEDFLRLLQDQEVEVWSSDSSGHRHLVRLVCL